MEVEQQAQDDSSSRKIEQQVPHQELQDTSNHAGAVVMNNPVIDVLSSPNKRASENEAISISVGSAASTSAGGAVVASTATGEDLIVEQSSSSSTTAVLDHENHDAAGCAIGALPPRTCFVKEEDDEGGTRTSTTSQNDVLEEVQKHHILRAGGSATAVVSKNLTPAKKSSNKTPSSGEAFHVESSDQHLQRFSSEQEGERYDVARDEIKQEDQNHLFLETPPLQFLAQCANGWTWTLFMFLDGLRTGIIPCTVQTLAGFLWVYLYRHCYRMDLYEEQLGRQTKILVFYLLVITVIFTITAAIDYPTVLTAWVDNETDDDSSSGASEGNQDYKSTALILEVKLLFQLLGMTIS